jgi:hypothetical protein
MRWYFLSLVVIGPLYGVVDPKRQKKSEGMEEDSAENRVKDTVIATVIYASRLELTVRVDSVGGDIKGIAQGNVLVIKSDIAKINQIKHGAVVAFQPQRADGPTSYRVSSLRLVPQKP